MVFNTKELSLDQLVLVLSQDIRIAFNDEQKKELIFLPACGEFKVFHGAKVKCTTTKVDIALNTYNAITTAPEGVAWDYLPLPELA